MIAGERRFQRQPRFGEHRLLVEFRQLVRGFPNGEVLANARLDRHVGAFIFVASLRGCEFLLGDRGGAGARRQFHVDAELPHGRHAALVEVPAGERVVGQILLARQVGSRGASLRQHLLQAGWSIA